MARIVYGAIASEIRGSIGGHTFQKNAYGYTIKNKANMIKPASSAQNVIKSLLSVFASSWATLTDANRSSWNSWAASYPQYAKHNATSVLSGYAVFVRVHLYFGLQYGGPTFILASPTFISYPITSCSLYLLLTGGVFTMFSPWVSGHTNLKVIFFLSQPVKSSVVFHGTKTRYFIPSSTVVYSNNLTTVYPLVFGTLPSVGDYVVCDIVLYGSNNGQVFKRVRQVVQVLSS
jgi:hypothetical protein